MGFVTCKTGPRMDFCSSVFCSSSKEWTPFFGFPFSKKTCLSSLSEYPGKRKGGTQSADTIGQSENPCYSAVARADEGSRRGNSDLGFCV